MGSCNPTNGTLERTSEEQPIKREIERQKDAKQRWGQSPLLVLHSVVAKGASVTTKVASANAIRTVNDYF